MSNKTIKRLCGAGATLACVVAVPAQSIAATVGPAAAGTKVTVRIEGSTHTLLAPKTTLVHPGSITAFGAPKGACSSQTAAGALDLSTAGRWEGSFSAKYGDYSVTSILGEKHAFSSPGYWALWVNDTYAQAGICGTKLRAGDRVLFGVDSVKKHEHPTELIAPRRARIGRAFKVRVVSFTDAGKALPLAGATVTVRGVVLKADRRGSVSVKVTKAGALSLGSATKGYVRAASVSVRVTK